MINVESGLSMIKAPVGEQFGKWTVLDYAEKRAYATYWLCRCACGTEKIIYQFNLKSGKTLSCGCSRQDDPARHGKTNTPEYHCWAQMLARCANKKNPYYYNYGGRGIVVCDRWRDFKNFLEDMGERPPGTSLDRIDNNSGYRKDNCRWADKQTQDNNKRSNHLLTVGCCTLTIAQWAKELSISKNTMLARVRSGWSPEKVISTPIQSRKTRIT